MQVFSEAGQRLYMFAEYQVKYSKVCDLYKTQHESHPLYGTSDCLMCASLLSK